MEPLSVAQGRRDDRGAVFTPGRGHSVSDPEKPPCIREHDALAGPDAERKTLIFIRSKPTLKKYERF
ncbi:MAG: hypothetical protein CVV35_02845 [Methanomicrobiales archaeon HGW-Methanomicrobiales-6]|nr:MAG: hypothetical protein CVV35_02845 [Methanomicrobiales archaeon HGW-Methanomicrobiales-6]